jgi:hypothetical protein
MTLVTIMGADQSERLGIVDGGQQKRHPHMAPWPTCLPAAFCGKRTCCITLGHGWQGWRGATSPSDEPLSTPFHYAAKDQT